MPVTGEILKIRPEVPLIICTGFSERIDEEEAQALGFKAFIRKPWRKAEMAGAIRKALDKNRQENHL
jgi:CheY-like chemotaxis protein